MESLQPGIYTFPEFSPEVLVAFSGREFDAQKNLSDFLKALGTKIDQYRMPQQVHGNRVVAVSRDSFTRLHGPATASSKPRFFGPLGDTETDEIRRDNRCETVSRASPLEVEGVDGLVTQERGLALVIRTADCVPVFLFDPSLRAVGLCHVGWRGARLGMVSKMLEFFQTRLGSNPASLQVALGPAIQESCYEVGEEFESYFPGFVQKKESSHFFNLVGWVKKELIQGGVQEDSVIDSGLCTACSLTRFFSARREGNETGRFLSLIMLK